MTSVTQRRLVGCDGYRVLGSAGLLGWIEEIWLGEADDDGVAAVVRLFDDRRGLLLADDVAAVAPQEDSLLIGRDARLLRLDPPHVEWNGGDAPPAATWRATGEALKLPRPSATERVHSLANVMHARTDSGERPVWHTVVLLYATLAAIVCGIIGLDFALSYLVTGGPPY